MERTHALTAEEIMKRDEYRKGKWTVGVIIVCKAIINIEQVEEERYTAKLIDMFNAGLLPPEESQGKTLRVYLAEKLNCDPMRITKKFTGKFSLGKKLYSEAPPSSEGEHAEEMRKELEALEIEFLKKVEETQCRPRGRQLPELDVHSMLHPPAPNIYMTNDYYKPNVYNFLPAKPPVFPNSYYYMNTPENQSPRPYYEHMQASPQGPYIPYNIPNFNPTTFPNPYMNVSGNYPYGYSYYPPMSGSVSSSTHIPHMPPYSYYPSPVQSVAAHPATSTASTMPPQQCLNSKEESDAAFMLLGLMQRPSVPSSTMSLITESNTPNISGHADIANATPPDSKQVSSDTTDSLMPPPEPKSISSSDSAATTSHCTTTSIDNKNSENTTSAVQVGSDSDDDDVSPRTPIDLLEGMSAASELPNKRARLDESHV